MPSDQRTRKRRFPRWAIVFALLFVIAWIAPWIVAATSLRNTVLTRIFSDVRGPIACESASFGWFSPVVLRDATILDADGRAVFSAPHIESDRTLLSLVMDLSDVGKFTINQPTIDVAFADDTTNVEQVFHEWIYGERENVERDTGLELEIVDGTIRIGEDTKDEIKIVRLHLIRPVLRTDNLQLEVAATTANGTEDGRLDATLEMHYVPNSEGPPLATTGTATLNGEGLPLAVAGRIVERFASGSKVVGIAGGVVEFHWNDAQDSLEIAGDVSSSGLLVSGPWLGTDELRTDELKSKAKIVLADGEAHVENLSVTSELGKASVIGRLPLEVPDWQELAREDLTIRGNVDLVRLAKLLPDTLRIREGTEITEGNVRWFATSYAGPKGRTWKADLVATDLAARDGERVITWREPINVKVAAHDSEAGPVIETVSCRSKFLNVEGSGSLEQLQLTAHADLAQLIADVGRFVDTAGLRLAGVIDAKLTTTVANNRLNADGNADLKNLDIALADIPLWREDTVRAKLALEGVWDDGGLATIDSARIDITGNQEQAAIRLEKPINDLTNLNTITVRGGYGGRYGAWPTRLATWLGEAPNLPFADSDAISFDSVVQLEGDVAKWKDAKLSVKPLVATGTATSRRVPSSAFSIAADGIWNTASGELQLENVVAQADGWSAKAPQFRYTIGGDASAPIAVDATIQGDLAKLRSWVTTSAEKPTVTLAGSVAGNVKVKHDESGNHFVVDAHIDNFRATSATGRRWDEKRLDIDGHAAWNKAKQQWDIERATIAGKDLSAKLGGHVATGGTARTVDLAGEVRYDLEKLSILLQSYLGKTFAMKGRDALTFNVRGKVPATGAANDRRAWEDLTGNATFAWDAATYQGFHGGPLKVDAKLANGQIDMGRIEMAVNEGRVALRPVVDLTGKSPLLTVAQGTVIDKVRITPEMCHSAIKYALPILADVAEAEGRLSVQLDKCLVPLADPNQSVVAGKLLVHKAAVSPNKVIGAIAIIQSIPTLVRIEPESTIPFEVLRGRVYHRNVDLIFGRDVKISTAGSVGFDNTLDVLVQTPIPSKILGGRPLGESLARQKIDIRITGTLDQPKINSEEVRRTIAKFTSNTVNDLLEKELGNALDKLFRRRD